MKLGALFLSIVMVAWCAVDVPVRRVVLYKHGVAYFERSGSIPAGEEARLDFKTAEMNDVLKSFTVSDATGNRLSGVRYDANEPIDQQLAKFPFRIGESQSVTVFLDNIKGAELELKRGDQRITGTIMGARVVQAQSPTEQLTMLLASGEIENFDLGSVASFRLTDAALEDQLKRYLAAMARSKSADKRSLYLDFASRGAKDLSVSYVAPSAIWKSSYRLALKGDASQLEGWAIVDNTTDEDWVNVNLSVVSGRPISFISLLDTPHFGNRQVAELPEDRAAGPVVYGGAIDTRQYVANQLVTPGQGTGYPSGVAGGMLGGVPGASPQAPPPPPAQAPVGSVAQSVEVQASSNGFLGSTVEGATGETIGEIFEYDFATPVTIRKNESAMLPFLQTRVAARKLLIYNNTSSEHPVNAVELANETGKTLDGGPVTVYDEGAYAGEALFETVKTGDKRLLGYAVDYGTRISTTFDSGEEQLQRVHVRDGNLELEYATRQTAAYTIRNVDAKAKTLLIEETVQENQKLLAPKPSERTAKAYRFEIRLGAHETRELKVEHELATENVTVIANATPDFLLEVTNAEIGESARRQLRQIAELKQRIVDAQSEVTALRSRQGELSTDQTRLRMNIDSLNRVKGEEQQVRDYSSQLAANEAELRKLTGQISDAENRKAALEKTLRDSIGKLRF